jgi:hypothetical protein|mmetsp:Transcript_21683/g.31063  ORF Transcript_21683/g.31063 Transcript_21683/m.31063 type:complete len:90 (-) Transcript_21683:351-620(-)
MRYCKSPGQVASVENCNKATTDQPQSMSEADQIMSQIQNDNAPSRATTSVTTQSDVQREALMRWQRTLELSCWHQKQQQQPHVPAAVVA